MARWWPPAAGIPAAFAILLAMASGASAQFSISDESWPTGPGYVAATCPPALVPAAAEMSALGPALASPPSPLPAFGFDTYYVAGGDVASGPSVVGVDDTGATTWRLPLGAGVTVASLTVFGPNWNALAILTRRADGTAQVDLVNLTTMAVTTWKPPAADAAAVVAMPAGSAASAPLVVAWQGGGTAGAARLTAAGEVAARVTVADPGGVDTGLTLTRLGAAAVATWVDGRVATTYMVPGSGSPAGPRRLTLPTADPTTVSALPGPRLYVSRAGSGGRVTWAAMYSLGDPARLLWRRSRGSLPADGAVWSGRDLILGGPYLARVNPTSGAVVARWRPPDGPAWPVAAGPFGTAAIAWPTPATAPDHAPTAPEAMVFGPTDNLLFTDALAPAPLGAPVAPDASAVIGQFQTAVLGPALYPSMLYWLSPNCSGAPKQ